MKTPYEWEQEALNTPEFIKSDYRLAWKFIEAIQRDAIEHLHNNDMPESEIWMDMYTEMREKWLSARRHLRAANKGAERNAIILQLAASRINSMNDPLEGKVWWWLSLSDEDMRLRMGELSKQEIRNIRACLRAILGNHKLFKHTKP